MGASWRTVAPDTHMRVMLGAMVWWERWAFNALHVVVAVTGFAYLYMKLVLTPDDPFAIINHPWQPAMLATHLIAAPFFITCFGMLFRSHTLRKLLGSSSSGRRTGWTSLLGFSAMALSGYVIQIASTPALIDAAIWTHVATSSVFVVGYGAHLVIGWRAPTPEPVVPRRRPPRPAARAALGVLFALLAVTAADAQPASPVRVARTVVLMGAPATFVTEAADRAAGLARLERMVRVVEATEAELSTWRDDSALSRLNRQPVGTPAPAAPAVCDLLDRLAAWHDATGGAFDPAVGRLVDAWGLRGRGRRPDAAALRTAAASAGWRHLRIDRRPGFDRAPCAITRRAAVTLDAGGFGKGEALDRVRRTAAAAWLIDFGGQVAVSGAPAGGWPVAVADPARRGAAALELRLDAGSLATSGGSERDLTLAGGARIGHVLDPRTGRPVSRAASVTVWRRSAFEADVLSTALYVMGPDRGLAWARARGVAACFLTPGPGPGGVSLRATPAFAARFALPGGAEPARQPAVSARSSAPCSGGPARRCADTPPARPSR